MKKVPTDRSIDVISQVEGLDIFIDGHSHSTVQNKVKDKVGKEVVIAQTGNYLNNIGQIIIHEDGSIETKLVKERSEDENIKTLIQGMNAEIQPLLDKEVCYTSVLLDGNRDPGVRTQETNLGDLVADALKNASGADVRF